MNGVSEGLTVQQMYLYLIALLKVYNKPDLQNKIKELINFSKGRPLYNNVKEYLEKLGVKYIYRDITGIWKLDTN